MSSVPELANGDFEKPATITSMVYQRLRDDILSAALMPGEKLRIEALRDRYEVSASPLREALSRLVAEGLVIQEDQKGFRVSPVSDEELADLTRSRCLINEIALRESIRNGNAAWEERVLLSFHRLRRATRSHDDLLGPEVERLHREFHDALISGCGSRQIMRFSQMLFEQARRYQKLSVSPAAPLRDTDEEHRLLMEAVLARDADRAVRLLTEHVSKTAEIVLGMKVLPETAEPLRR